MMHLNCHSPHAVLFGESKYGGLSLPELYTDQGHHQLKLLIRHLKLKDQNGDLIYIDLTNVQLVTGAIPPFFSLPYLMHAKWINWDWIVSICKYTAQLQIVIDIEHMWIPLLVRDHDVSLMDSALKYNFSPQYLREINQCHIFLQVITLADITLADGTHVLPKVLSGEALVDRHSTLHWP
jgi:hypothetical protein